MSAADNVPAGRPEAARWIVRGLTAAALLPVIFMVVRTSLAFRNAAYWDEMDTVLEFLLRVRACATWQDVLGQIFALGNEHRTVTSRLIFTVSYWLTGTVNFTVIGIIGNACLFGICGVLLATAGTARRRLQLGLVLAAGLFQLQHFENFFWSGSSIDHFQVVTLATVTFAALAGGSPAGVIGAGVAGFLATFTLAQGLLVWPVGALALASGRRWRQLGLWGGIALFTIGVFFTGYGRNSGHAIGDFSLLGIGRIVGYWLALLGSPVALGNRTLAPFLGAVLLILAAAQFRPAAITREKIILPLLLWAVGALLLIAIGRVDVVGGHVHSRYYVLSCLAWALVIFLQLQEWHDPARPHRALLRTAGALAIFNLSANLFAASDARSWIICRDSALENYLRHGRDGQGPFFLHPVPSFTDIVTRRVEQAGIYYMPQTCRRVDLPTARPVGNIIYFIDRIPITDTMVAIEGWTAIAGQEVKPGQIHLVLQSTKTRRIYTTLPVERLDVSKAHPTEKWRHSGFRFEIRRWLLPREDFQIGLLLQSGPRSEFIMTAHRLDLSGPGRGVIATGD